MMNNENENETNNEAGRVTDINLNEPLGYLQQNIVSVSRWQNHFLLQIVTIYTWLDKDTGIVRRGDHKHHLFLMLCEEKKIFNSYKHGKSSKMQPKLGRKCTKLY